MNSCGNSIDSSPCKRLMTYGRKRRKRAALQHTAQRADRSGVPITLVKSRRIIVYGIPKSSYGIPHLFGRHGLPLIASNPQISKCIHTVPLVP